MGAGLNSWSDIDPGQHPLHDLAALTEPADRSAGRQSEFPGNADDRAALVVRIDQLERELQALGLKQQQLRAELEVARAALAQSDSAPLPYPQPGTNLHPPQKVACWFLAMDFDEANWKDDFIAVRETCVRLRSPAYVERSRSGNCRMPDGASGGVVTRGE